MIASSRPLCPVGEVITKVGMITKITKVGKVTMMRKMIMMTKMGRGVSMRVFHPLCPVGMEGGGKMTTMRKMRRSVESGVLTSVLIGYVNMNIYHVYHESEY